jgi:uncharacterized repeat protein (TIGR03803 family)
VAGALRSSVEWIAEAPAIDMVVQPLANFGIGRFGYDNTGVAGTCDATVGTKTGRIGSLPHVSAITMIDEASSDQAVPSPLSPDGSSFTVRTQEITLLSFDGTDGANPVAGLVQATDGDLYGTTLGGGATGGGTVFEITLSGALTTLYSFCPHPNNGCTDGNGPYAGLIQATNGDFYGETSSGGANGHYGTVFKITPSGTLMTLHSFCSESGCTDGNEPVAGLVQATDGDFYGTTYIGGANGGGTVFTITPSGTLTTLYSFCAQTGCTDGANPYTAPLVQDTNGDLYGTTLQGGISNPACTTTPNSSCGTVFRLSVGLGPFVKTQPTSGEVGAAVKLLGTNLTGASNVSFNGTAALFTVVSPSLITTTVPTGATTGMVQVVTPSGSLLSNVPFRVP